MVSQNKIPKSGFFTVSEFAAIMGCHSETVRRWCRSGRIPEEFCYKLRAWRISPYAKEAIKSRNSADIKSF